jgi:hypothetical protein
VRHLAFQTAKSATPQRNAAKRMPSAHCLSAQHLMKVNLKTPFDHVAPLVAEATAQYEDEPEESIQARCRPPPHLMKVGLRVPNQERCSPRC